MRSRWTGAVVVLLTALLPLLPVLLQGQIPSFRDHHDYFAPMRAFTVEALQSFELPLWNPYNGSGEAWLANPQTGVFYPPTWFMALVPFQVGYVLFLIFHLGVLGLGIRRLLRLWVSDTSATIVAAAFVVSGPVLSLLDVSNNLCSFAWVPWIFALAFDRSRRPQAIDSVLLAFCFLGGEPILAIVAWAVWAIARGVTLGRQGLPAVATRLVLATALAACQLVPFVSLLIGSDRASGLTPDVAFRYSLAPVDWLALVVSPAGVLPGVGGSQVFLPSLYLSPLVVLCALAAILNPIGPVRVRRFLLVSLAVSFLMAAAGHLSPVRVVFETLHLTANRYPVKFALFGFIVIAIFGAIGCEYIGSLTTTRRILVGAAGLVWVVLALSVFRSSVQPIAIIQAAVAVGWLGGFFAFLYFAPKLGPDQGWMLVAILLPAIAFESVGASRFLLEGRAWPMETPYANVLDEGDRVMRLEQLDARRLGDERVTDRDAWMGGYLNLLSRQHDASSPAPVVAARYQDLHDLALSQPRHDLLDFLSVRYLLTERDLSRFGYDRITGFAGVSVFERPNVSPPVTVSFDPRSIGTESEAFDILLRGDLNAVHTVLATGLTRIYPSPPPRNAEMSVSTLEFTADRVVAEVDLSADGLVVLNQRQEEGWRVHVDGVETTPVLVNGLFRGAEVEKGKHRVVWRYRPSGLYVGIFFTLSAMIVFVFEAMRWGTIHLGKSRASHSERA